MIALNKKLIIGLATLITVLAVSASTLFFCSPFTYEAATKEEISQNVESAVDSGESFVTPYLREWGLPGFDNAKMYTFELYFRGYYNYDGGMPDCLSHAKELTKLFLHNYFDIIDRENREAVTDALLTCYVAVLDDPYAVYRPYEATEDYFGDMSGKFGGIGVMIEYNYENNTLKISNVYENSPSEQAGIQNGDFIIAVDGKTIEEIGLDNVVYHVRGEIGTYVELTLLRGDEEITVSVLRAQVEEINASYEMDYESGLGYIRIVSFKDNTFEQFKKAVDTLEAAGAKGIVFDLRATPGGYLYSVADVVSYLVPTGHTVVSYQYKNSKPEVMTTKNDGDTDHVIDIPFVVLCDGSTASAGEIFTSAMRDYRIDGLVKCSIVGTRTYGKGIMQNTFTYNPDGSSTTMTVAYYSPPSGNNYHGIGVTPDVIVELEPGADNQLEEAYKELNRLINEN